MRLPTTVFEQKGENRPAGLQLVVMAPDAHFTVRLPDAGILNIGRAENAEVRLTDPLASRLHARLHVGRGGTVDIEDLGSINLTKMRDVSLRPGERVAMVPGEAVTIGSTVLMVQPSSQGGRSRQVLPHAYYEARLEEECARSSDTREPFTVLRLHVGSDQPAARVADLVAPALRLPDMLALYGPSEYELLLPNTPPELGGAMAQDLIARLAAGGVAARTGLACYPRDGVEPEALLAQACERVRGVPAWAPQADRVMVGDSRMQRLYDLAQSAAAGTISILIVGETGVGKEVMAHAIHDLSPRAKAPFVCVNCASLADNLLESELFGHEKGAFTGASDTKAGLLETAPGGTVFLDEVGELPLSLQPKLLRVIETKRLTRIGSLKERPIDVRFVAATNRELELDVAAGRFRRDLYYRLNGVTVGIPPLRERRAEIEPLAQSFVAALCAQMERTSVPRLSARARELLESHAWPGNIRELRNVIERALLLCRTDEIGPEHLPAESMTMRAATPTPTGAPLAEVGANEDEKTRVLRVLNECAGNQSRAARLLGLARSTLVARLDAYGVARPRKNA